MKLVKDYSSVNFSDRQNSIDSLVIHSTEIPFKESLEMLLGKTKREVSAHYLMDLDGTIYELVLPEKTAWHAGKSFWRGREQINQYSVGIEIVDTDSAGNHKGFNNKQINSLIELCHLLISRYPIDQRNIVAHSDIAPTRKKDPGEKFPWEKLYHNEIGIFYDSFDIIQDKTLKCSLGDRNDHVFLAKKLLSQIGYKVCLSDIFDEELEQVVIAFKRRFYQDELLSELNVETFEIMHILSKKFSNVGS